MKKIVFFLVCCIVCFTTQLQAQSVAINNNDSAPDSSAILHLHSLDKGVLIPRMKTYQREGISNPAHGLLVFDTQTNSFWFYDASQWIDLSTSEKDVWYQEGTSTPADSLSANMYHMGNVAIGKDSAHYKLDIYKDGRQGIRLKQNYDKPDSTSLNNLVDFAEGLSIEIDGGQYYNETGAKIVLNGESWVKYGQTVQLNGGDSLAATQLGYFANLEGPLIGQSTGFYAQIKNEGDGDHFGSYNLLNYDGSGRGFGTLNNMAGYGDGRAVGTYNFHHKGVFDPDGTGEQIGTFNLMQIVNDTTHTGTRNLLDNDGDGIHYGTRNEIDSDGGGIQFGSHQSIVGSPDSTLYSIFNTIQAEGDGEHYGNYTEILNNGNGEHYGNYNLVSGGGSGKQYGTYNLIDHQGTNAQYGVLNSLIGDNSGLQYGSFQSLNNDSPGSRYAVQNTMGGTADGNQTGVRNTIVASGDGEHIGVENNLTSGGSGDHYGSYSTLSGNGTGIQYGDRVEISNSANSVHYGEYITLSGSGTGVHYGSRVDLSGNGPGSQYGNYVDISNTGASAHYGLRTNLRGSGNGIQFGVRNVISNTGSTTHYGTSNELEGAGNGVQIGTYQAISNTGLGSHFGNYNLLTGAGTGSMYGSYNVVTVSQNGAHYGTYNRTSGTGTGTHIAGYFEATGGGSNVFAAVFEDGSVVANESGGDNDFRVESDNNENMLFVDGNLNRVGIKTNAPDKELDVRGSAIIERNSGSSTAQLTLKENGVDYSRLTFLNDQVDTTYWTVAARANDIDASSRFNVYYNQSGNVMSLHGDGDAVFQKRLLVGSGNPDAMLHVESTGASSNLFKLENNSQEVFNVTTSGVVSIGGVPSGAVPYTVYMPTKVSLGVENPFYRFSLPNSNVEGVGLAIAKNWLDYSDARVKKNVVETSYGLKDVLALRPVEYDHHSSRFDATGLKIKEDYTREVGFLAQDVYEVIEEVVKKPADESTQLWSMDYERLTPVLVKAIQELAAENEQLKSQNGSQQTLINQLSERQTQVEQLLSQLLKQSDQP